MPKQSTAAQNARKDARAGMKYTKALRARNAGLTAPAPAPHVVRFLAERPGDLYQLVGGIAASWAHTGQRVLVLQEASDSWRWAMRLRPRSRRKQTPATPPEPTTSVLWTAPADAPGRLVHHTCMWETLVPSPGRGFPDRDRSELHAVLDAAQHDYDVIVMMPDGTWSSPDREAATAHVVLATVGDFPHTDCRNVLLGSLAETGTPLSPEQSAAVLRERCLAFLFSIHRLKVPLEGVIWHTHEGPPVDAAYLAGIDRDMDRVGLPSLGWTVYKGWVTEYGRLPEAEKLQDPNFVRRHERIATRVRAALDAQPVRAPEGGRPAAREMTAPARG